MFSHEGTERSDRQNRVLAGYLAFIGGFVDASGVVLLGTFTSHVSGNLARVAQRTSSGDDRAAIAALALVAAFGLGAFTVSLILESRVLGHVSRAYALALAVETSLLGGFVFFADGSPPVELGALLSFAMGMQNGLVTRLSGAVVRTTHVTGVVTDLGIEAARWFRYWRGSVSRVTGAPLVAGPNAPVRPPPAKALLLVVILISFFSGAVVGALATLREGRTALVAAAIGVGLCAGYAFVNGRRHADALPSR